jgi:transcriptional regulator with XRE-family HTH domain
MNAFGSLLRDLAPQYGGTKQDLARAIGITPSVFSRLLSGAPPPSVEVCLRLALVTATPASVVLRAAGLGSIDELIQNLYGPAAKARASRGRLRVTPLEEKHLKQWRSLGGAEAKALGVILDLAASGKRTPRRDIA